MERRFLGRSGLEISVLGFGLMTFGEGAGGFGAITAQWRLSADEMEELEKLSATAKGYPRSARDVFHPERNPVLFPRPTHQ